MSLNVPVRGFDANVSVATAKRKEQEFVTEGLHSKTFGVWINKQLQKKGYPVIRDVCEDFKTGVNLIHLLEAIYGEKVQGKYNPNPTTEIQKVENVAIAIGFMQKHKNTINLNSKDITDGNRKLTLGLMWRLIMGHAMLDPSQDTDEISAIQRNKQAKANLLGFCQKQTAGYQGVNIQDLSNSWHDGRGFCALVHSIDPSLLDWNSVTNDVRTNMEVAFSAAERLGIPRMLDVNDMSNSDPTLRPDEKCIMTYLSEFPLAFIESQGKRTMAATAAPLPPPVVVDNSAELERQQLEYERLRQEEDNKRRAYEEELRRQHEEQIRVQQEQFMQQAQQEQWQREQAVAKQLEDMRLHNERLQYEQEQLRLANERYLEEQRLQQSQVAQVNYHQTEIITEDNKRLQEELERLRRENNKLNEDLSSTKNKLIGKLQLVVKEARNIRAMDLGGKSDPYIRIKFDNQEYKTKIIKKTLNPHWDQEFELFVTDKRSELELTLFDWDRFSKDDFMGRALVRINDLQDGQTDTRWHAFQPLYNEKVSGEILVSITFKLGR